MPDPSTPLDVSLTLAVNHAAWAKEHGQSPEEVLASIGEEASDRASWDYVVGRLAAAWRVLRCHS